jgi:YidC/Oxa1 family membrane protein insertase
MKELQPQVKQLQEQLKNDPKRMQIEMMNLYRKNGMKFMGMEGCFPMLLQIPVFFAFYTTLRLAYELRGASWLWIPDLGVHDPIYALPILMGIGMFLQQRATTVAADPAQAKVMMFMPVIMTFMFLKLPAGLVLYWTVNSLCTIVIQKILQWRQHAALPTATA